MPMKRASDRRTRSSPLNKFQSNGIRNRPILRDILAASVRVQRLQKTDYTSEQGRKCCLLRLRQSASSAMEWCLEPESNRYACLKAADFKSAVSTNFTIEALARLSLNFNGDLIAHEAPAVLNACQCGRCRISLWHVRAETASKASLPRLDHPVALRPPKATAD